MMLLKELRWCWFYLGVSIGLGVILRMNMVFPMPLNFRYLTHAHSHVALLGWVYMITTTLIQHFFLKENTHKHYKWLFFSTQISILGMLVSFPVQGYGGVSIAFCSIFILCTYAWSYLTLKYSTHQKTLSFAFIRLSIMMLILSSLGVWLLPLAIAKAGKHSNWYNACIYGFLHFQYNGWVLSALLGLILRFLEEKGFEVGKKTLPIGFCLALLGSLSLSLTGLFQQKWLYGVGLASALMWLWCVYELWDDIRKKKIFTYFYRKGELFLHIFFIFLVVKNTLILLSGIPAMAQKFYFNKDIVIGYLHFVFLGLFACGWLFIMQQKLGRLFRSWQISLYFTAFFSTEMLIIYKGIAVAFNLPMPANYFEMLGGCCILFLAFAISTAALPPKQQQPKDEQENGTPHKH